MGSDKNYASSSLVQTSSEALSIQSQDGGQTIVSSGLSSTAQKNSGSNVPQHIVDLHVQLVKVNKRVGRLEQIVKEKDNQISKYYTRIDEESAKNASLTAELYETRRAQVQALAEAETKAAEECQERVEKLKELCEDVLTAEKRLNDELAELREEKRKLIIELEEAKVEKGVLTIRLKEARDEISRLETQLRAANDNTVALHQRLKDTEAQLEDSRRSSQAPSRIEGENSANPIDDSNVQNNGPMKSNLTMLQENNASIPNLGSSTKSSRTSTKTQHSRNTSSSHMSTNGKTSKQRRGSSNMSIVSTFPEGGRHGTHKTVVRRATGLPKFVQFPLGTLTT